MAFSSIDELEQALLATGYLPDRGLATALFLCVRLDKPLLLEGEPGVGIRKCGRSLGRGLPSANGTGCPNNVSIAHS